jgi:hypothetical protein
MSCPLSDHHTFLNLNLPSKRFSYHLTPHGFFCTIPKSCLRQTYEICPSSVSKSGRLSPEFLSVLSILTFFYLHCGFLCHTNSSYPNLPALGPPLIIYKSDERALDEIIPLLRISNRIPSSRSFLYFFFKGEGIWIWGTFFTLLFILFKCGIGGPFLGMARS